jgi:alpha-glucosidase
MPLWWQQGIVYQIYPRSFQDSSGNGVGDLPGIIQRLDYLAWLGIEAIWISPVYPSPMADFGYDVSDYVDIHPLFGTLADMDALIEAAHNRDLKVILDFVPGHTSDQHPWFRESRSSRDNPRRDWYFWQDPAVDGGPPNNWLSRFDGKSGWTFDEHTGQYYLHSFLKEQPDLNWRNPDVRAAMLDVLRFWFDRGVDGFRIDVSYRVMKDPQFPDNPPNPDWHEGMDPSLRLLEKHNKNHPDVHHFNRWVRSVADEYDRRVLIGEINVALPNLVQHYGQGDELHLPFNFRLLREPWEPAAIRAMVEQYERLLPAGAWPNYVLGNHDIHRVATRVGPDQARVAMMLLLTLRGTPTMYYGDEIGMEDVPIPPDRVQDPWELFVPGMGLGRDPERTPMQWDDAPNAGFCPAGVTTWLPIAADYETVNVVTQQMQEDSMLRFTRRLIALRREHPALNMGAIKMLDAPEGILAYVREDETGRFLVVLNFTGEPQSWTLPVPEQVVQPLLSTHALTPAGLEAGVLALQPDEGLLLAYN